MPGPIETVPPPDRQPTLSEVTQLIGGTNAARHAAVFATGATFAEINRALAYARGDDEILGETSHPLEGRAAAVYEILTADEALDEEPVEGAP